MYPTKWRFTPVRGKNPFLKEWQQKPHTLAEAQALSNGIGLLLGEQSGGVMALDFDGLTGMQFFVEHIGVDLPETVTWTSGKHARMQMAFNVPLEYWPNLKTYKDAPEVIEVDGKQKTTKKLEFRWNGTQSVLPPSPHPEEGYAYEWLVSPAQVAVATIPKGLITWWKAKITPVTPVTNTVRPALSEDKIIKAIEIIKRGKPSLDFEAWLRISKALQRELGLENARAVMSYYWPEQEKGDYQNIFKSTNFSVAPTAGTLVHIAREFEPNFLRRQDDEKAKLAKYLKVLRRTK